MRAAHGEGDGRGARAPAEVGVVAARVQDPVAPADVLEADVQLVPAALLHVGLAVGVALGPVPLGQRRGLDHQEGLEPLLHRHRGRLALDRAGRAGYLDRVVQPLLLDPLPYRETHVRLHPALCANKIRLVRKVEYFLWKVITRALRARIYKDKKLVRCTVKWIDQAILELYRCAKSLEKKGFFIA